jgi:ATP-binding cassette subfamily B multidrug efflux pump
MGATSQVIGRGKTRYRRLWGYVWEHRWLLGFGLVSLLLTNQLALAIPKRVGLAMDALRGMAPDAREQVGGLVWVIVGLASAAMLARVLSRVLVFDAGRRVEFSLRNEVFAHLTKLDVRFYQGVASGDLTSRIANDVNSVRMLCGFAILNIVNTLVAYATALTRMASLNVELTLWCLAPYPLAAAALWQVMKRLYDTTQRAQAQLAVLSSAVQEDVSAIASIKAFGAEPQRRAHFLVENERNVQLNLALARLRGAMGPLIGGLSGLGVMIVLYVGGPKVVTGELSLGNLVEFNAYVVVLSWPTAALAFVISLWQRGMAGMDRLLDILERVPAIQDGPMTAPFPAAVGSIALEGVRLTLANRVILQDVSLRIQPGEQVAIVGWTGAGKTTLLNLIARLLDPTEGCVRVDGEDVRSYPVAALRQRMGYVTQEPFLFSASLRHNIAFGLDDPPLEAVEEAAELAGLSDDIARFPQGLETMVGERGVTVSGGQKQRLTLARALILRPHILLLDDVLSSVDARTERAIFDALTNPTQGEGEGGRARSTVVFTTHRFQGLERMDRVLVLHEGALVEQGHHHDLIAAGGHYAQMWRRQQLEASIAAA